MDALVPRANDNPIPVTTASTSDGVIVICAMAWITKGAPTEIKLAPVPGTLTPFT